MEKDHSVLLGEEIAKLRKQSGMTQEALAGRLNLSFQAVSKWENGASCPDITLLPAIADIFGTSVDELFGRTPPKKPIQGKGDEFSFLPWADDGVLRAAAFIGRRLVATGDEKTKEIKLFYEGDALDVVSHFNVTIEGDASGNVSAGCDASIGGDASGDVSAMCDAHIGGDALGGVSAMCDAHIGGDVSGDVSAGCDANISGDVSGDVSAGCDARIDGDTSGDVSSGCDASIGGDVSGDVSAGGTVTVGGSIEGGLTIQK